MGKYAFVHRTIELWNWLPAEALAAFTSKSHIIRKRFRRAIISEEKWGVFEAWWRNIQKCRDVKNGEWSVVQCSEAEWSEDLRWNVCIIIDLHLWSCVLVLYGTLSIIICFYLSFSNYLTYVFKYPFYVCFVFCVFCVFLYFLCRPTVSLFVYSCLFPIFVQVYRPLPPGGNPIAVNKYHIISYHNISYHVMSCHIISYHISYHIVSYHISYHIISYHIVNNANCIRIR